MTRIASLPILCLYKPTLLKLIGSPPLPPASEVAYDSGAKWLIAIIDVVANSGVEFYMCIPSRISHFTVGGPLSCIGVSSFLRARGVYRHPMPRQALHNPVPCTPPPPKSVRAVLDSDRVKSAIFLANDTGAGVKGDTYHGQRCFPSPIAISLGLGTTPWQHPRVAAMPSTLYRTKKAVMPLSRLPD